LRASIAASACSFVSNFRKAQPINVKVFVILEFEWIKLDPITSIYYAKTSSKRQTKGEEKVRR